MKKILVFGMTENPGGVESFLMNYYRRLNNNGFSFDFLCNSFEKVAFEDELIAGGSRTFHFPPRSRDPIGFRKAVGAFFREHAGEYDVIWENVNSLANVDYLKLAKKYRIPKRIIHSHNSRNMDSGLKGKLRKILHLYNRRKIASIATDFWACSEGAADWFYRGAARKNCVLIHNAIDVEKLAFSSESGQKIRSEHGFTDAFLIGNVGRLHFQKNQKFVLEVFAELLSFEPSARLVLIGQGEDEAMLKERAKELGVFQKTLFAGVQYNIPDWFSAMDLMLFPSVFEGWGIVALEAQANGLPVLASKDAVPAEVKLCDSLAFLELEKSPKEWARKIIEMKEKYSHEPYEKVLEPFRRGGYDVASEAEKLKTLLEQ